MIKRFLKTACSLFLAASACLCVSAAFEKTVTYAEGTFKDIPSGAWYAQEVKNTYVPFTTVKKFPQPRVHGIKCT